MIGATADTRHRGKPRRRWAEDIEVWTGLKIKVGDGSRKNKR